MGYEYGDPEDDEVGGEDGLEAGYDSQPIVASERTGMRLQELEDVVEFDVCDSDVEPALE